MSCWGDNDYGVMGSAGPQMFGATPIAVSGIQDAWSFAAGSFSACAVVTAGHVSCWGSTSYGELGNGQPDSGGGKSPTPVGVVGIG